MVVKLYCWQFEYSNGSGQCQTGVCAYTLSEARSYFIEKLNHEGLTDIIPLVPSMEPKMYDDTEGMSPGWK